MSSGEVNSAGTHPWGLAERRRNRRLRVALDVEVRLDGCDGQPQAAEKAQTRNVSSGDLYYESSLGDRLRLGDILDVHIELPVNATNVFSRQRLKVQGRVTRLGPPSDEEPNRRGVGVRFLNPPTFQPPVD